MKQVWKKDMKAALPVVVTMGCGLIVLECLLLMGLAVNQYKLIVTCLYIGAFALPLTIIYIIYGAGNLLLRNYRDKVYFEDLTRQGVGPKGVIMCKYLYNLAAILGFLTAYALILYIDIRLFIAKYPEEKEKLSEFGLRKMVQGDGDPFVKALLSTILEYVLIAAVILMLAIFIVTIVHAFFTMRRLTGFTCVVFYIMLLTSVYKGGVYLFSGMKGISLHLSSSAYYAVLTVVMLACTFATLDHKLYPALKQAAEAKVPEEPAEEIPEIVENTEEK